MVRFIFALALVMLTSLACGVGEATPTPQSLERRSPPAVTPAPRQVSTPTAFQARVLSVDEYSKVCGELMDSDPFLIMSTDLKAYREWLDLWMDSWLTLKAPPELSDFHNARTAFFQYPATADGEARGPSAQFQRAYDAMLESMVSLPVSLREPLSATGCVSSVEDFSSIARDLDTKARLDERETSEGPLSIDEYAEWCADIVQTIPWFADRATIGRHLKIEWGKLTPPPDIAGFHGALLEWYDEFERTGTLDAETPVGQRVSAELRQMDFGHFERLYYGTGCVGQRFVFTAGRAEDSHPPEPPPPTPRTPTPTPNVVLGEPSPLDEMLEGRLQAAIDNIPDDKKIWIDDDTVVYLLPADPHDFNGAQVAVAHHLPSKAAINYDAPGVAAYAEDVGEHPDARAAADRMAQDPKVANAVATLLRGK